MLAITIPAAQKCTLEYYLPNGFNDHERPGNVPVRGFEDSPYLASTRSSSN